MPDNLRDENYDAEEDFGALLDQHLPAAGPKSQGDLVDATVIGVMTEAVLVTYGSKEEIAIPIEEFLDPKRQLTVKPGDTIRALVTGWDDDGNPELSYRKARSVEAAAMLEQAAEHKVPVRGIVKRAAASGLIVDVGIPAFMPASHIDLFRVPDLNAYVGQELEALVIEYDASKKRAVLSRRQLLQGRADVERKGFIENVQIGSLITGVVKDVLDFGAFVAFGNVDGFIPRSELTYDRGTHPSELLKPGDKIEVKVLEIAADTGKITLSRKRVGEDPWTTIAERFPVGASVSGKVVSLQSFGAFVQLQEGITGLIHAKDISWESDRKKPEDVFKIGDMVNCQVTEVDTEQRRLGLSLKHLSRDPWLDIEAKYPVGSRQKATVAMLRDFGAIVKLDESVDALLHVKDLSWTTRPAHPGEIVKEGQELEVQVLGHDSAKRRISVGLKQLSGSPFDEFLKAHPVGSVVTGKPTRFAAFGAFIELVPGVEGLMHISEVDDQRVDNPDRVLHIGEDVQAKIIEIDAKRQRISLSRKQAISDAETENIKQYTNKESKRESGKSAFGSALLDAFKKKAE